MATSQEILQSGKDKIAAKRAADTRALTGAGIGSKSDAQKRCESKGGQYINGKCVYKNIKSPTPTPQLTPTLTPTQDIEKAKQDAMAKDPIEASKGVSEDLFGTEDFRQLSESEINKEKQTRLERELEQARQKAEIVRKQNELAASQRKEGIDRSQGAYMASLTTGREGVQANAGLGAGIARGATRQLTALGLEIEGTNLAMQQAKENIDRYELEEKRDLVKAEQDRLARLQEAQTKLEEQQSKEQDKVKSEALQIAEYISSLSPTSIAGMDETELTDIFSKAGLPSFAATAFISENTKLANAMAEFAKDPENVAKKNKVLALQGKIDQIKNEVSGSTAVQKNVEYLNQLRSSGTITEQQFQEALNKQIGVESSTDKQLKALKLQAETTKDLQEKAKLQEQMFNLQQLNGAYAGGKNPIDKLVNFTSGDKIKKRYGVGSVEYAGQCGAFVNDLSETPYRYGSSLVSKTVHINNTDILNPQAGSIFISSKGNAEIGHVGFVKSVNNDGTVTLADVNRYGKSEYNERNVRIEDLATKESILGYENLGSSSATSGIPSDVQESINSLFVPGSGLTYAQVADGYKGVDNAYKLRSLAQGYQKRKTQLANSPDIYDRMLGSAGNKPTAESWNVSLEKTFTAVDNIQNLSNILNKTSLFGKNKIKSKVAEDEGAEFDISPITGWLKSKNPWSDQGALANAALTQSIPNLARGVYGEVGVLTDQDVALYKSTLPNLTQPEDIRKSITALTLRSVKRAIERKITTAAGNGSNVSGLIPQYKSLVATVESLEAELGIVETDPKETYLDNVTKNADDKLAAYVDSFN